MTTIKLNHQECRQDGITIKGDYNIIYGKNCTIIGNHNKIYGDYNNITGDYNVIYSSYCNVYGDYCIDKSENGNNYIGNGNYCSGLFSAREPFNQKKLNSEMQDNSNNFGLNQGNSKSDQYTMSSDKTQNITNSDQMLSTLKSRAQSVRGSKDPEDVALVEEFDGLLVVLRQHEKKYYETRDAIIADAYDEIIKKKEEAAKKKQEEEERKAEERIKKAEENRLRKKRELEEAEASKKADEESTKKNMALLSGLLKQMSGTSDSTTVQAPTPTTK